MNFRAKSRKRKRTAKNVPTALTRHRLDRISGIVAEGNLRTLGFGFLLVILTIAAFWPALRGGFIWDDDLHLTANRCIVGPLGFQAIWTTSSAVSDGYFVMVRPLSAGEHVLHFGGAFVFTLAEDGFDFSFTLDITYRITVSSK